jgi:hypothetical protein
MKCGVLLTCGTLTAGATAVAVSHAIWPGVKIDGVTLGLIGLAILPWLAPIIKSVELPGIGKIELQEVKAQVEELRGQTASANQKADTALAGRAASMTAASDTRSEVLTDDQFLKLAARYNEIRRTQNSGPLRTGAMTDVVVEMMNLAYTTPIASIVPLLYEEDDGRRLFAYAYLYARPEPKVLPELVRSVVCIENSRSVNIGGYRPSPESFKALPKTPA